MSRPIKHDPVTRVFVRFQSGDTLDLTVDGNGATVAERSLSSSAAASGAQLVGVDTSGLTNSSPADTDLQSVLEALDTALTIAAGINQLNGDVTAGPGGGNQTASVVRIQGIDIDATPPSLNDILKYDGTKWAPAAGGSGGTDLQGAYNAGNSITENISGGVLMVQNGGSPLTNYVLRLESASAGGAPLDCLQISRDPSPISAGGAGINLYMGANAQSPGIYAAHLGSDAVFYAYPQGTGDGLFVYNTGTGDSITVNGTAGTGDGISVLMPLSTNPLQIALGGVNALTLDGTNFLLDVGDGSQPIDVVGYGTVSVISGPGDNPFQSQIDGENAFTVDGTNFLVDIGSSGQPLMVLGYGTTRMGTATGTTHKTFEAYTTNTGADPTNVNNLGRIIMRPGTGTAVNTVAELSLFAGSAGEIAITKAGHVFAQNTLLEYPIEDTVTLAAYNVVSLSATSGRVAKADATHATKSQVLGICLVGGTGDAGGTVSTLVALNGAILSGFSGLTVGAPVWLSDTTAGLLTSTPPTAATAFHVQVGYAVTASAVVVLVESRDPAPLAIRSTAVNTQLTEMDYTLLIDCSGGNRVVTLPTVLTNRPRPFLLKKYPGGNANKISLVCAGSEEIEGGGAGVGMDLPDSTSTAAVGPSWTLLRDASGSFFIA